MSAITPFQAAPPDLRIPEVASKPNKTDSDTAEIKRLAEEFESLFLGIVLKSMRDTVPKDGLVNGGNAEEIYRSMLDTEYSKEMARQRNTGLANNIEEFLLKAYTAQNKTETPPPLPAAPKAAALSVYERASRLK